jgi:hypothetical protein
MFDIEKLQQLQDLSRISTNMGQQFIHVDLNLTYGNAGTIRFGFDWKCDMGSYDFHTLDEAIEIVKELRKRVKDKWD